MLKFHKAPISTTWGLGMMHATVELSKDETADIYVDSTGLELFQKWHAARVPVTRSQIEKTILESANLRRFGDTVQIVVDALCDLLGVDKERPKERE